MDEPSQQHNAKSRTPETRALRHCPFCNYDLTGVPAGLPCPECGSDVAPQHIDALLKHPLLKDEQGALFIAAIAWLFQAPLAFVFVYGGNNPWWMYAVPAAFLMLSLISLILGLRVRASWTRRIRSQGVERLPYSLRSQAISLYAFFSILGPMIACCNGWWM